MAIWSTAARPLFRNLGILTLPSQYILVSLVYVKQNEASFINKDLIHDHNVRNKTNLDIMRRRLVLTSSHFPDLALKMYNKLPSRVKLLDKTCYERVLVRWLKDVAYYSIDEFFADSLTSLWAICK